jgi:hypothetical protein
VVIGAVGARLGDKLSTEKLYQQHRNSIYERDDKNPLRCFITIGIDEYGEQDGIGNKGNAAHSSQQGFVGAHVK